MKLTPNLTGLFTYHATRPNDNSFSIIDDSLVRSKKRVYQYAKENNLLPYGDKDVDRWVVHFLPSISGVEEIMEPDAIHIE